MTFELKLAWRYFRARPNSLARFTALIAVIGITAGIASLIIAQSLARGFRDEMQDKILANTAHITILKSDGSEISNWRKISEALSNTTNIKGIYAQTYHSTLIIGKNQTSYAVLKVNKEIHSVSRLNSTTMLENIDVPTKKIAIGNQLSEKTGLKKGDFAEIIISDGQSQPKNIRFLVNDIFQTGIYEYDSTWIYISPADFARIFDGSEFTPTILGLSVTNIFNSDKIAEGIRDMLGEEFRIIDWQEANKPLFSALSLERKVAFAIISLIILIAALNISTTLALIVNERRLDFAILRTCGAKTKSFIYIFLFEGLFLGLIGVVFGVSFGLFCCFIGNYFQIIRLSEEIYELNYIPFRTDFLTILLIAVFGLLLSVAATVYPALKASRIKPLENLRTQ